MRVLHVISGIDPRLGGPPRALAGLVGGQLQAGLQVGVLATWTEDGQDRSLVDGMAQQGAQLHLVGPAVGRLKKHPQLGMITDRAVAAADVVHIHTLWEEIQHRAAAAARRHRKPYIIRPCGMLDPWSLRQSWLVKKLYMLWRLQGDLNAAAALHFTTTTECDLTRPLHLRAPTIVEPNGVSLDEFQNLPEPGGFRRRHPEIGDRPLIVFLSRLHHKKGLDLLIPAFARCGVADAVLALVGPAVEGYLPQVQAMAREHGVRDRVVFTGMLNGMDRVEALVDADLYCLPSYQENFGIAVVEALAAGTPVVISDQVNIHHEVAAAGVGGVTPTRVEPLAEQLRQWLTDKPRRDAAAARCRSFVWDHYDWNAIAQRWAGHYDGICSRYRA